MYRRLQQLVFVCFFALLASAAADERPAQDLAIAFEDGRLTLTYVAYKDFSTELQASMNLIEWGPADVVSETATDHPDGTRVVKAVVSSYGSGMFFHLRRANARHIAVAWDPAIDSSVVGYIIRLRRRGDIGIRRIDAGNATTATLVLPQDGGLYSFDVVSYTAEGLESEPSNAIAIALAGGAAE